jgi:hypothetical protein
MQPAANSGGGMQRLQEAASQGLANRLAEAGAVALAIKRRAGAQTLTVAGAIATTWTLLPRRSEPVQPDS